jgi:hypothetical protein
MPSPKSPQKPAGWTSKQDDFILRQARNGEDPMSIAILCETEYDKITCSGEWVRRRLVELSRERRS